MLSLPRGQRSFPRGTARLTGVSTTQCAMRTPNRGPALERSWTQGRGCGTPGVGPRPCQHPHTEGAPGPAAEGGLGFPLQETKGRPGGPGARLVGAGPAGGCSERVPEGVEVENSLSPQEKFLPRPRKPARHSSCHTSGTSDARTSPAPQWGRHCMARVPVVLGRSLRGWPS